MSNLSESFFFEGVDNCQIDFCSALGLASLGCIDFPVVEELHNAVYEV